MVFDIGQNIDGFVECVAYEKNIDNKKYCTEEVKAKCNVYIDITNGYNGLEFSNYQKILFANTATKVLEELKETNNLRNLVGIDEKSYNKTIEEIRYYNIVGWDGSHSIKELFVQLSIDYPTLSLEENLKRYIFLTIINNEIRLEGPQDELNIKWEDFWFLFKHLR